MAQYTGWKRRETIEDYSPDSLPERRYGPPGQSSALRRVQYAPNRLHGLLFGDLQAEETGRLIQRVLLSARQLAHRAQADQLWWRGAARLCLAAMMLGLVPSLALAAAIAVTLTGCRLTSAAAAIDEAPGSAPLLASCAGCLRGLR